MSLSKIFKTDETLESKGAPITFPANDDGTVPTFYLARMAASNVKYQKAMENATRPYRRELQLGTMPENKAKEITLNVFLDSILVGWEHVLSSDVGVGEKEHGKYAAFHKAHAKLLMERLPELYAELQAQAKNIANFIEAQREDEAKN